MYFVLTARFVLSGEPLPRSGEQTRRGAVDDRITRWPVLWPKATVSRLIRCTEHCNFAISKSRISGNMVPQLHFFAINTPRSLLRGIKPIKVLDSGEKTLKTEKIAC